MAIAKMGKAFKSAIRWLWLTIALLIIGTVILVVIGRQTIAGIDSYRTDIQQIIEDQIGLRIELGELNGDWPRLVPILDIESAAVFAEDNSPAIVVSGGRAHLDLFETIIRKTPIWRELVVDSLQLTMVEDETGSWGLKGFGGNSDADLSLFVDPLSYSRLIQFRDVQVVLQFFSGKSMLLNGRDVAMENADDFHRAELSVIVSEQQLAATEDNSAVQVQSPAYLLIEGYGDVADVESFFAEGYFRFDDFNLSEPLADLSRSLLPSLFANLSDFEANANGEIWFAVHPGGSADFEGMLAIGEIPLNWLADVPPITNIKTEVTGWYTPASDWGLRLQGFDLDWSDAEIEPLDLVFTQRLGSQWKDFDVSINHLDLTLMSELLSSTQIADKKILNAVENLQPQGVINALTLGHDHVGYYASANLEEISIASWKGSPSVKALDGYIEVYGERGLFSIADTDGFDVYFPSAYKDYLSIDEAMGSINVSWQKSDKLLTVRSNTIRTKMDAGSSNIMFSVQQTIPSGGNPPEVNLMIGARNLDAEQRNKYLPYSMPGQLNKWLTESILDIQVEEFGLLIRNSPPKFDRSSQTTQLIMKTTQGDIDYDPRWTGVRDADSLLLVDDGYTEVIMASGTVGSTEVSDAKVVYAKEGADNQPFLFVDAQVEGDLSELINILADSPLKNNVAAISDWNYSGKTLSQLDLVIPMSRKTKVDSNDSSLDGQYNVATTISEGSISIPNRPISMTDIQGQLNFSVQDGLYGEGIRGNFWQRPMVSRLYKTDDQQKIAFSGDLLPESLNQLVEFPWQKVVVGAVPIEGLISIPAVKDKAVTLQVSSQLEGVALDLPAPLVKSAQDSQALDITFYFSPEFERLTATLEGRPGSAVVPSADLHFDLHFNAGEFNSGQISYDRPAAEIEDSVLRLSAYLPTTELESWRPLAALFEGTENPEKSSWKTVFDLRFDQLELATFQLKDIAATATFAEQLVDIDLRSDLVEGHLLVPTGESLKVPEINLSRLTVPSSLLKEKVTASTIDPRRFLALDLAVDQLIIGEDNWGSLSFDLRPEVSGAAFSQIKGNLFGLKPGAFENQPSTEFFWQFDGNRYASRLVGPVGIDNIGDFLSSGLGIPKIVDSQSGRFVFDLAWQDQPWKISRENISGEFAVELREGSFYKSPGGSGAALKMVSLVNFANWLRRLKLDFSDVVGQNLAYNKLNGTLHFDQGVASLRDPLRMKMPSGRMSMAGDFDLLNEQVDGRLVATLPVATNLPWVVALMGGLPAAAGVYVTSKLVEKQVDRLSSISYKLSGSWDDVDVEVDRIFAPDLEDEKEADKAGKKEPSENKDNNDDSESEQ
ncbi:MAG: AsmA-like C-terminal region-containing protein [Porticoccaceae bacterium]|nr:AsmA-like C-terminal region-containing protein [Porticoccaceae bacterium]